MVLGWIAKPREWRPVHLTLWVALCLGTLGNLPLWRAIGVLPEMASWRAWGGVFTLWVAVVALLFATLSWLAWSRARKPVVCLLWAVCVFNSYFMWTYGVVIDASMMANVLNTDLREVRDLLAPGLWAMLVGGLALPAWWYARQRVPSRPWTQAWWPQFGAGVLGLGVAVLALAVGFQDLASLMRNHKTLRFMLNPYNTVYGLGHHALTQGQRAQTAWQPVGTDAVLVAAPGPAPLLVLVVGETARAANFGLGGYGRDTTPQLRALQAQAEPLLYFSQVASCGTNTETSVPCMFAPGGREAYLGGNTRSENLLDVLQRAGMAVWWLDNQSGCKGVCDRVPHAHLRDLMPPETCPEGECPDLALLQALQARVATQTTTEPTVVVLHQMGSHGPAYHKRSPPRLKAFQPECQSASLPGCEAAHIVNAYDNSLRATDELLAETVRWLRGLSRPTALFYVSDHGESLGEKGLYLHGMPYRLAPSEQTHVPMLMWLSPQHQARLGLDVACWRALADRPWSHDQWFPTVLDLAQVHSVQLGRERSLFGGCVPGA